jgi:Ca-activated chloride channel family protein
MIRLLLAAAVSWPVGYNDGVTAYRSNDFTSATAAFEQATASPDRTLQQRAHYNLGNAAYRLGEADPTKAQSLWERAVKNYETALALDSKDEDAKFNHDFVKKKLEELKKQEQQQQDKQNQQDQKNQQDKQQEQNKDNQQQQQQEKKQDQPQSQEQKQDKQQQQPQPQNQQKPEESKPQEQQAQPQQLDRQEAKALLDNLREDERNWNFFPEVQMKDLKDLGEPAKDW